MKNIQGVFPGCHPAPHPGKKHDFLADSDVSSGSFFQVANLL